MMSVCGNFAVEEGEFCDGGFDGMMNKNDCCNDTCHFKEGAVCRWVAMLLQWKLL